VIVFLNDIYSYLHKNSYTVGGNAKLKTCDSWNVILKVSVIILEQLSSIQFKRS